jgi:acyl carrier protein
MSVTIEEIKQIISLQLGRRDINDDDHFLEDLHAESFDVMNIVIAIEDKYGVSIKEVEIPSLLTPAAVFKFVKDRMEI